MIDNDILKNNTLIAHSPFSDMKKDYIINNGIMECIGYTSENLLSLVKNKSHHDPKSFKYDTSWEWLMPVAIKINKAFKYEPVSFIENQLSFDINTLYNNVVEAIRWYNKQNVEL